jgi:hypothetical protein
VLFVEDLRVGDVLEYAYTIRGANPVLGGHYSSRFMLQSYNPVGRELFRIVWDDKTPLPYRLYLSDAHPAIQPRADGVEYAWGFTNLAAISYEDCQPASFEPCPYVEASDFPDWRSVVNWALPLYDVSPTNVPAEMRDLIAGWESSALADEEKARWALQFVQDNLRYTGIELGPDSYRPSDPVETFQKRYGDCKGKTVLLRFLLQQMNIESYPALVNSSDCEAIGHRLPSPFAFNHAILQVKLFKRTLWLDPTASHQGGLLWSRYVSPFGKALVIRPGNDALEDVSGNEPDNAWQQNVTSTFFIKDYESPVRLTIRTEYRAASADDMRGSIAGTDATDLARNYFNYYTRLYSGLRSDAPLKFGDNRQANIVTVEESYTITNLWTLDEPAKLWKATFYADNFYNALTDPETRIRKTPLALSYPMLRKQQIIVHLPDKDWQVSDLTTNVENDAFSFKYKRHLADSTVTYDYECRTKVPSVAVDSVPGCLAKRDRLEDLLTDTLQRPAGKVTKSINWLMVVVAIFGAGATALGCTWYWRRPNANRETIPPSLNNRPLQGLGGWLILVGFGLCLTPIVRVVILGQNWEGYFSAQVWQAVAMPQGESYHPLYGPLLIFEMLGNVFFLGLNLLTLGLFFAKRKAFPNVFIAFAVCFAIFLILDDVGCMLIPSLRSGAAAKDHTDAIRQIFYAMIWSLYMVKSKRVKATFIR